MKMLFRGKNFLKFCFLFCLALLIILTFLVYYYEFEISERQFKRIRSGQILNRFNGIEIVSNELHDEKRHQFGDGNNPFEKEIEEDLRKQWYGFGDKGVAVGLFGDEKERGAADVKRVGLNEVLSDHISYNRTVPDTRNPMCNDIKYDLDSLPSATVIMIFLDETYSVLLRSVHSLLNTGTKNLKEIILVDDGSANEDLKGKLDYYIQTRLPNYVKVIRLPERKGLIRARQEGARIATSDILIFMDAHSECEKDWLQPLLQRIKEDKTRVLMPITETIITDDFRFLSAYDGISIGGFSFTGVFEWMWRSEREQERRLKECGDRVAICPYQTPTMVGGYLAIDREFFWKLGGYDEKMEGWGGENLEMSFRVWMCGGSIEAIPCSRIGHLVRFFHQYKLKKDTNGFNVKRMAEVWMDQYKEVLYMFQPHIKSYTVGELDDRKKIRENLHCKDFKWYLDNIFPEKYVPMIEDLAYGRLENEATKLCLDSLGQYRNGGMNIGVYVCNRNQVSVSQLQFYTKDNFLRYESHCFTAAKGSIASKLNVTLSTCDSHEDKWEYTDLKLMKHSKTNLCMDAEGLTNSDFLYLTKCNTTKPSQKWIFSQ